MKRRKILPPTYLLISILIMVGLHFLFPVVSLISIPWNLLGLLPLALGMGLNFSANNTFQQAKTTIKPFEVSNTLVTAGLFRLSRNPMYLGFVLVLIGIALLLGSLTPWLLIPVFIILMDRHFIQVEEQMLEAKFDQTWLEYKAKVRRWI